MCVTQGLLSITTRDQTMTEKGFEFRFATKGNLQGLQAGLFIQTSPNSTHS